MDPKTTVKVSFSQYGTWGWVGFAAELFWKEKFSLENILANMESETGENLYQATSKEYIPALRIIDGPEKYIGLEIEPGQEMPGMFAEGYDHPLSGKCFLGEIKIGDTAADLKRFALPELIYSGEPGYLHISDEDAENLTKEQRELLLKAVRFDRQPRFKAGKTVAQLFTREELEGKLQGKVFYA